MPLTLSQPIPHGTEHLHTAPPLPHHRPRRPPRIAIGNLNIRDGQGFRLALAIRTVERRGFDVILLTKTKIQSETYLHNRFGYDVTCSVDWPSIYRGSQGGVGLVTREKPFRWGIESTRYHRPNVVNCKIVTGLTRTPLVGAYLPPSTLDHLSDLEEAL